MNISRITFAFAIALLLSVSTPALGAPSGGSQCWSIEHGPDTSRVTVESTRTTDADASKGGKDSRLTELEKALANLLAWLAEQRQPGMQE